jgi:MTH538 TIR-like domain (DUF1863)
MIDSSTVARSSFGERQHEHIDFSFAHFQLEEAVNSNNPYYIKSKCAAKIRRADTFVLLIRADTYTETQLFVEPEVEAAIEKGCRLIGVNSSSPERVTECLLMMSR